VACNKRAEKVDSPGYFIAKVCFRGKAMNGNAEWLGMLVRVIVGITLTIVIAVFAPQRFGFVLWSWNWWGFTFFVLYVIQLSSHVAIQAVRRRRVAVPTPVDVPHFTQEVLTASHNFCAISSKPLALWESPTFIYHLFVNGLKNLCEYSTATAGILVGLSPDQKAVQSFLDERDHLLESLAGGNDPESFFGLRFLIYPESVFRRRGVFITRLLEAHHVARVHCIPLIKEKLLKALEKEEKRMLGKFSGAMEKRWDYKFWARFLKWVPDVLLIDNRQIRTATTDVWWYAGSRYTNDPKHAEEARAVFRIIAAKADRAIWPGYKVDRVAVTHPAKGRQPFFSLPHFGNWLAEASLPFREWFEKEDKYLESSIPEESVVLDVGCGFGRHMEMLAKRGIHVVGIDNNITMIEKAVHRLLFAYYGQVEIYPMEAAHLSLPSDHFDSVICMTNTFGNMQEDKQRILREMKRVAKPGGRIILSVYKNETEVLEGRRNDYKSLKLEIRDVREENGIRTIITKEGLVSEQFSLEALTQLFSSVDLEARITELSEVGFLCELSVPQ